MKLNKDNQLLYDTLFSFIKESIPLLRKEIDVDSIPKMTRFKIVRKDQKRNRIIRYEDTNWWQIDPMKYIYTLPSFQMAVDICKKNRQINKRDGMASSVFYITTYFKAIEVPTEFLKEVIVRENGLKFKKNTFDSVFNDLIQYISPDSKLNMKIIAPFDNLRLIKKSIELESNLRIREVTLNEQVEILKYCTILHSFYGAGGPPNFRYILEYDMNLTWNWFKKTPTDYPLAFRDVIKSQSFIEQSVKNKIHQELIILRAITNLPIISPTYVIYYKGWTSGTFTGGIVNYLPYGRAISPLPERFFPPKLIANYMKYRKKLLEIKNMETQQRIFVAMRKLSSSMDKFYAGDQLMDTVSGLEGLLVDSKQEVRHKFAERVAILLEKDIEKRMKLQKNMRKAYDYRSRIAHGSIIADNLESIISNIKMGHSRKEKKIKQYREIQEMRILTRRLLHQAIHMCIEKQTTEFDWDSLIMKTKAGI